MTKIIKQIEDDIKASIVTALLSRQKKMIIHGIEVILKPLKPNTTKRKELQAIEEANKIYELIISQDTMTTIIRYKAGLRFSLLMTESLKKKHQ